MDGRTDERTNGRMDDGRTDVRMDVRTAGGRTDGRTDCLTDGWKEEWMGRGMNERKEAPISSTNENCILMSEEYNISDDIL